MDYLQLKQELINDPSSRNYSQYIPGATGAIAQILNEKTDLTVKTRMVTARGIMASYGLGPVAGAVFLDKLEALSANVPAIKWALKFLQQETGVDVGESATRQMLDSLVGVGGITQQEVTGVKNMALQSASRAEKLFGDGVYITELDVIKSLEN